MFEVKIDKNITASKFAHFLSEKVFPHIPADNLYASKVVVGRAFKRGDLVFRKWSKPKTQSTWIGQSVLEINRDGAYVVVKDNEIKLREDLTEEELKKYGSSAFIDHIEKRSGRTNV